MAAIVHAASGHIIAHVSGALHGIEVADDCLLREMVDCDNRLFFHDGEGKAERAAVLITANRLIIEADGVDSAQINGLPDPCWAILDGTLTPIAGGTVLITSASPRAMAFELAGAYRSERLIVRAMNLADLRARRWSEAKAARDAWQDGGCDTPLGRVDSDADSRLKISGAVQMAMIAQMTGAPFAIDWTMADNSIAEHDGSAMIAMGLAVAEHVRIAHETGRTWRAAIDAAADAEALLALNFTID